MKKALILISISILVCPLAVAQELNFGVKAGLNLSTLQPDMNDPATRTSFHLGGIVEIPVTDQLSVQPELLYSSQGVKDASDDDEVIRLNYLTVPVMLRYVIYEGLSVEVGPQVGFLLSAEREDDGETADIKDISKSTDFGIAFGAGYRLEQGIHLGLRYYLGSDINDIDEDSSKIANRVFQISVGYFFN